MQHMVLVPQFTVFWNVQYKVKVPCNFLQLSLFLPGCNQWSQTFDTEMSYKIYTEDGVSLHYCVLFVKLWKWEVHVYILINSFVHDVECITVWTLRIHFVRVICMYMSVLLYSRCFLKKIFKSALWTYCIYREIFTLILFFRPFGRRCQRANLRHKWIPSLKLSLFRQGETLCIW